MITKEQVENLKVGDKFYEIYVTNTVLSRKKIKTVIDGVEWYRYDKPNFEYELREYVIIATCTPVLEGEWKEYEPDFVKTFYVANVNNENDQTEHDIYSLNSEYYFLDKSEALKAKEEFERKENEVV